MDIFCKRTLRNWVKETLQAFPEENKKSASLSICQHLQLYLQSLNRVPSALLGFFPFPDEPDLRPFYRKAYSLFPYIPIGFPRIEGEDLVFHRCASSHHLVDSNGTMERKASEWGNGPFGTLQPSSSLPKFGMDIPWGKRPLVLIPGRVFDPQGGRIGRGKGYYDRFLRSLRQKGIDVDAVGICFSIQVVQKVPRTEQDEPVDHLITEEGVS